MQHVHFQVRVGVFSCQQILINTSFVIFDMALVKFHWFGFNWPVFCILLLFRKSRHKPSLESTSKYGFPPIWGGKMAAFWACTCKLSWTLFSPARVQPLYGAGRKESSGTGLHIYMWRTHCSHTYSRALRWLHVIAFEFWLVQWIVCILCDWSDWSCGFGCTILLKLKTSLCYKSFDLRLTFTDFYYQREHPCTGQ